MKRKILSMVIGAMIALGGMLASGANVFTDVNSSAYWGKTDIPKLTTVIDANFALLESGGTMAGMTFTGATKFTNSLTGLGTAILTNAVIEGSTIGVTYPLAGAFTTLNASSTLGVTGVATFTAESVHNGGIDADYITVDAGAGIDCKAAGALQVGIATATSVDIGGAGEMTTVKGTLNVDQAVTLDSTLAVSSTLDVNGDTTSTNITMDSGSTLAAQTVTVAAGLDVNAPATATNITLDAGAKLIGTTSLTLGGGTETVSIDSSDWDIGTTGDMTGIGSITMNGALSGATSITVDGKGVLVDESGNVQLVQTTNVTMHSGTVWTQTWSTVFAATPTTVIITPTELHAAVPFYSSATPSNILITVEADKNFTLTCIGQK